MTGPLPTCECGHAFRGHLFPARGLLRCAVCSECDLYHDPGAVAPEPIIETAPGSEPELSWKERRAVRRQQQLDAYAAEIQETGLR